MLVARFIPIIVHYIGGSEIAGTTIAHLAHTISDANLMSVWNPATMITVKTTTGIEGLDSPYLRTVRTQDWALRRSWMF